MLHRIPRVKKLIQVGMLVGFAATLSLIGTAGATNYKYEQVYAQTYNDHNPHKHLDVVCKEGWRAISCEAAIYGDQESKYFIAVNEGHPETFRYDNHQHQFEHESHHVEYYGCHFRANNFLQYFHTSDTYRHFDRDFNWQLRGYATCVYEGDVYSHEADWYHAENGYPHE